MKVFQTIKIFFAICLIALPMMALHLQAQQIGDAWNPSVHSGAVSLWSAATNWSSDIVPVVGYKAFLNVSPVVPCVVNGTAGGCQISIGDGGPGELIVTNGGNLTAGYAGTNIDDFGWTAIGLNHAGTMIVEPGANVTFLYHMYIGFGSGSTGTFIMNGGTASIQNQNGAFAIGTGGGTGIAEIYGGTLTINNNIQLPNAGPQINVAGGTLIINLNGNTANNWYPLIAAGQIVAYGGTGTLNVSVNYTNSLGQTIITASTNSSPGSYTNFIATTSGPYLTNSILAKGQMVLKWNARGNLETATNLGGPWTVATNFPPYTNHISGSTRFFRLNQTVDATTLHQKVLCGYQGWFRCPGDPSNDGLGWTHWFNNPIVVATNDVHVEMWPDMSELTPVEQFAVPGWTYPDGSQACLYSAQVQETVQRHFGWMQQYGVDGVFLQRFVVSINSQPPWMTNIINYARVAANNTGRTIAIAYDCAGADENTVVSQITNDWKWLVNSVKLTSDPRYLHHNGKPVVMIWDFDTSRFPDTNGLSGVAVAQSLVSWFKTNGTYNVTLVGGTDWDWRTNPTYTNAAWQNLFHSFDVLCPWNTGNYSYVVTNGVTNDYATTSFWAGDMTNLAPYNVVYYPQIYPGFSWDNMNNYPPGTSTIPRLGGDFYWKQFYDAANLGLDMAYVGMFDEVDEGTAIFKVSNTPPVQHHFVTYDGYPTDWYLRLTEAGAEMLDGQIPITRPIPIQVGSVTVASNTAPSISSQPLLLSVPQDAVQAESHTVNAIHP